MQATHEFGHICGAWVTGGQVEKVVLHPLTISRTDVSRNPSPLVVVWAGPILGSLLPLGLWMAVRQVLPPVSFLCRFFAGFCLIANGAYIAFGSFAEIGDCGEMLRHGSPTWALWFYGTITIPMGIWLWHGQGLHFGLADCHGKVNPLAAYVSLVVMVLLLVLGLVHG